MRKRSTGERKKKGIREKLRKLAKDMKRRNGRLKSMLI